MSHIIPQHTAPPYIESTDDPSKEFPPCKTSFGYIVTFTFFAFKGHLDRYMVKKDMKQAWANCERSQMIFTLIYLTIQNKGKQISRAPSIYTLV